jgi:hypothetical protein
MSFGGAVLLSDLKRPCLGIVFESCGRAGRYNVARLIAHHGDARLPDLLLIANPISS